VTRILETVMYQRIPVGGEVMETGRSSLEGAPLGHVISPVKAWRNVLSWSRPGHGAQLIRAERSHNCDRNLGFR
jgi:hypothetical protein